jgi:hypothetical protein
MAQTLLAPGLGTHHCGSQLAALVPAYGFTENLAKSPQVLEAVNCHSQPLRRRRVL